MTALADALGRTTYVEGVVYGPECYVLVTADFVPEAGGRPVVHPDRDGEPYYIGVCLMGAYQDVLGDLHTLFGEAHEVIVTVDEQGRSRIDDVLPGESCERVLEYMNYDKTEILDSIGKQLRRAAGRSLKEDEVRAITREFESVFSRYTYLER